jgi:spore maturation protein CgeB
MGLKILRISFLFYESVKKRLEQEFYEKKIESYQKRLQKIFDGFYLYSDSFSFAMRKVGYEAEEVFYDFKLLQESWAKENGYSPTENWQEEILLLQIEKIRPDFLYLQDINAFSLKTLKSLKKRFSFLKAVIIFRGYPLLNKPLIAKLRVADILLVGCPKLIPYCRSYGLSPHLLYHSFDGRILDRLGVKKRSTELSFCGSSGYGNYFFHLSRYFFLKEVMAKTDLQAWIEENECVTHSLLLRLLKKCKRQVYPLLFSMPDWFLEKLEKGFCVPEKVGYAAALVKQYQKEEKECFFPTESLTSLYPDRCFKPLFGLELYKRLYSSKITLNKHALVASPFVDNLRLFDATGVGSCLVTERGENLSELFKEDEEVVCYSSKEECIEKIEYLKRYPEVRESIAKKGQERTIKNHNPLVRAKKLDVILVSNQS